MKKNLKPQSFQELEIEKTIKDFDLLIYQARNDDTKNFVFYIGKFIYYEKETYRGFKVIKVYVMLENSIVFTKNDYLFS